MLAIINPHSYYIEEELNGNRSLSDGLMNDLQGQKHADLQCKSCNKYRKFMQTDDAIKDFEETAFTVSQTSRNSRKKLEFANPQIKSKRTWLEAYSFCRIATVEQLKLKQTDRQIDRHTHTLSVLPYSSCGYASKA